MKTKVVLFCSVLFCSMITSCKKDAIEQQDLDVAILNPFDDYGKFHNKELDYLVKNQELLGKKGKSFYREAIKLIKEKHSFKTEVVDENQVYDFVECYIKNPIEFTDSILRGMPFAKEYINNFLSTISTMQDSIEIRNTINQFEYYAIDNSNLPKDQKDALLIYFATFRNSYNFWVEYSTNNGTKSPFPAWVVYGADAIGLLSGIITVPAVAFPLAAIVSLGAFLKE